MSPPPQECTQDKIVRRNKVMYGAEHYVVYDKHYFKQACQLDIDTASL